MLTDMIQASYRLASLLVVPYRLPHVAHLPPQPHLVDALASNGGLPHTHSTGCSRLRNISDELAYHSSLRALHLHSTVLPMADRETQRTIHDLHYQPGIGTAVSHRARSLTEGPEPVGDVRSLDFGLR